MTAAIQQCTMPHNVLGSPRTEAAACFKKARCGAGCGLHHTALQKILICALIWHFWWGLGDGIHRVPGRPQTAYFLCLHWRLCRQCKHKKKHQEGLHPSSPTPVSPPLRKSGGAFGPSRLPQKGYSASMHVSVVTAKPFMSIAARSEREASWAQDWFDVRSYEPR